MTPSITIIYVNYQSAADLNRSLQSVVDHTNLALEVIIVENASGENLDHLKGIFEEVRLIYSEKNLGFGKACNLAVAEASAPFVLLLNPDTMLTEPSVEAALEAYQYLPSETRGALTCRHVAEDGSLQASSFQRAQFPRWPFLKLPVKRLNSSARDFINKGLEINKAHERSHRSFAVHGSFFLIETSLLQRLTFDEDFFLYAEEIDLCRRLYQMGRPSFYLADTTIMHTGARAAKSQTIRHQIYLSNALLVLKFYGRAGYLQFLLLRWFRAVAMHLILPFVVHEKRLQIKSHLLEAKPFSKGYFRILWYRKKINSHIPLMSQAMRIKHVN